MSGRFAELTPSALRKRKPPAPDPRRGKAGRGRVLVIAGSRCIPGAGMLSAEGALRAGAGTVQLVTARSVACSIAVAMPELYVLGVAETKAGELTPKASRELEREIERADAVLIGPGMRDSTLAARLLHRFLTAGQSTRWILDAAAIESVKRERELCRSSGDRILLTPHPGEMAKLIDRRVEEVQEDPCAIAIDTATSLGVNIAFKGSETFIASSHGECLRSRAGDIGLGTAGSGDVLAGIIAGYCARGHDVFGAAAFGVYVHGKAGEELAREMGSLGFLARELLRNVPTIGNELEQRAPRST